MAAVTAQSGEILVSHDSDFKAIARRFSVSGTAGRHFAFIKLSCFEPSAAARLLQAMTLIEHEFGYHAAHGSGVVRMEILKAVIRIER